MIGSRYFGRLAVGAWMAALLLVTLTVMVHKPNRSKSVLFSPGEPLTAEEEFMSLHPVYTRCSKKADMAAFTKLILVKCGDIHELTHCSWTCTSALQTYSNEVGCCWESVMDGYEALDPNAAKAWRLWQGTASGKCGVTFDKDSCGESMGEKGFNDIQKTVETLKAKVHENSNTIDEMESSMFGWGWGSQYKGSSTAMAESGAEMAQPPAKIGDITVDETLDFPGKGIGDLSVPVDKLQPEYYARGRHSNAGNVASRAAFPPPVAAKARVTELTDAYEMYRNYQNSLRLTNGYDARFKPLKDAGVKPSPIDGTLGGFNVPGHSWQDKAPTMELAGKA